MMRSFLLPLLFLLISTAGFAEDRKLDWVKVTEKRTGTPRLTRGTGL